MRLTTKTNLAARVLMACAFNRGKTLRTSEIAEVSNASLNHLLQVVNGLQAHGFIETLRGRHGGLRLARAPEQISMGSVFRVFEPCRAIGPRDMANAFFAREGCGG